MTQEEMKNLAVTLGGLSESECDVVSGLQSKIRFAYATNLNEIGWQIEGMTSAEIDDLIGMVEPLGPGNGKRKIRKQ